MGVVLISADLSNGELSMRVMYHLLIMTLQSEQVLPVICASGGIGRHARLRI